MHNRSFHQHPKPNIYIYIYISQRASIANRPRLTPLVEDTTRREERKEKKTEKKKRKREVVQISRGSTFRRIVRQQRKGAAAAPAPCRNYPSRMNNPSSTRPSKATTAGSVGSNQKDPTLGQRPGPPSSSNLRRCHPPPRRSRSRSRRRPPLSPINLVVLDFAVLRREGGRERERESLFSHGRK